MKYKNRILPLLMAGVMAVSLAGCTGTSKKPFELYSDAKSKTEEIGSSHERVNLSLKGGGDEVLTDSKTKTDKGGGDEALTDSKTKTDKDGGEQGGEEDELLLTDSKIKLDKDGKLIASYIKQAYNEEALKSNVGAAGLISDVIIDSVRYVSYFGYNIKQTYDMNEFDTEAMSYAGKLSLKEEDFNDAKSERKDGKTIITLKVSNEKFGEMIKTVWSALMSGQEFDAGSVKEASLTLTIDKNGYLSEVSAKATETGGSGRTIEYYASKKEFDGDISAPADAGDYIDAGEGDEENGTPAF